MKSMDGWFVNVWQKILSLPSGSSWLSSSNERFGCCCGSSECDHIATVSSQYFSIFAHYSTVMPQFTYICVYGRIPLIWLVMLQRSWYFGSWGKYFQVGKTFTVASKSVSISAVVISLDPLSSSPSTPLVMKILYPQFCYCSSRLHGVAQTQREYYMEVSQH